MTAEAIAPKANLFKTLSDSELEHSLHNSLSHWNGSTDLWLFAYGSLIWRPDFPFIEQRPAMIHGYHRSLCLWSRINRGTPDTPGVVFALDQGGQCEGIVYRIASDQVKQIFPPLWRREMPSGAYNPMWIDCDVGLKQPVQALAFVINPHTDAYVPEMPLEQLSRVIHAAHGINGPCIEYVLETAHALKQARITDHKLEHLISHLQL